MFTEEELARFQGVLRTTPEFVEIDCGCTSPKYGDTPGKLRVYVDGKVEIDCNCSSDCPKVNLSPVEFAKHAGRTNSRKKWRSQIWVFVDDWEKIRIKKTCLLKHHTFTYQRPLRQVIHRDEFLRCSRCNKERRFILRSRDACKAYHEALLNKNWKCSDMTNKSCDDAEERESRRPCRGCPRDSRCEGCEQCVCLGCDMCRFDDCNCQPCLEFIENM